MPIARSLLELVIHGRRKQKENVNISAWTSPGFLPQDPMSMLLSVSDDEPQ